ncbi:hypothetical protein B0H11DRAFT_753428 [Mycena galericulata]|nr:hypothetical protein B0H11DRAFT_753428 [Mycena galericulata]
MDHRGSDPPIPRPWRRLRATPIRGAFAQRGRHSYRNTTPPSGRGTSSAIHLSASRALERSWDLAWADTRAGSVRIARVRDSRARRGRIALCKDLSRERHLYIQAADAYSVWISGVPTCRGCSGRGRGSGQARFFRDGDRVGDKTGRTSSERGLREGRVREVSDFQQLFSARRARRVDALHRDFRRVSTLPWKQAARGSLRVCPQLHDLSLPVRTANSPRTDARRISTPCVRVLLSTRGLSRAVLYCGAGGHKSGVSLLLYLGTHLTLIASRSRTPDAATQALSSPRPAVPSGGKTTSGGAHSTTPNIFLGVTQSKPQKLRTLATRFLL